MKFLGVGIFFTILGMSSAFQRLESINRYHFGVSFRHHGKLLNDVDTWTHTFEIRLLPTVFHQVNAGPCNNASEFYCLFRSLLVSQFNNLALNATRDVQATFQLIEEMIGRSKPPPVSNSRSKRAPLSFVGDLANSIFGVATTSDVKKLAKHIDKLYRMHLTAAAGAVSSAGKLSTYMKTSNQRMDNLMRTVATIHEEVLNATRTLYVDQEMTRDTQRAVLALIPALFTKLQQTVQLERMLESLLLGVNALLHRRLSPLLVDQKTMAQTLQDIQRTLKQKHPEFDVVHKDPRYYYHSANVLYAGQVEQILIVMEIPIASTNTQFELYQVLTYPVPFNSTSNDGTLVTNLPDYVAISTDERYMIEMTAAQMALCHGRNLISCPDKFPHKSFNEPSCTSAMIRKSGIRDNCQFEFREAVIVPSVVELDEGTLLLTRIPDLIFTCNNHVTKKSGCPFCLLQIPCFCSVMAGKFSFSPRLAACQERAAVTVTTSPGVNLALLQQFFNGSQVADTYADRWFRSKIPYSIPPLRMASNQYSQLVKADQKLRMNLNDLTQHMKDGKAVYRTAVDAYIQAQSVDDEGSFWQLPHIIAYVSLVLTILLYLLLFVIISKFKPLLPLLLANHTPTAHSSQILTWPDPNLPSPNTAFGDEATITPFDLSSLTPVDHSMLGSQAFICLALTVIVALHVRLAIRSVHYSSEVMLELCGENHRVNIYLCTVAKCPGDYCIPVPTWLHSFTIVPVYRLWGELHLNWPQLMLKEKKTGQEVAIPLVAKLSLFETYVVRKIQKGNYTAFLKIKHGDTATYLRKPNSDSTTSVTPLQPSSPSPSDAWTNPSLTDHIYPQLTTLTSAK